MLPKESLLEFPCEFAIKAMGKAYVDFESDIVVIVRRHVADLGENAAETRESRAGNYLSTTVRFIATSRAQLDDLYRELGASPSVTVVL